MYKHQIEGSRSPGLQRMDSHRRRSGQLSQKLPSLQTKASLEKFPRIGSTASLISNDDGSPAGVGGDYFSTDSMTKRMTGYIKEGIIYNVACALV